MPPCSLERCHDVISFDVLHLHINPFIFFITFFITPNFIFVIPSISEKNGIKISRMQKKSSLIFFIYIWGPTRSENVLISKGEGEDRSWKAHNLKKDPSINQVIYISPNLSSVATFHHQPSTSSPTHYVWFSQFWSHFCGTMHCLPQRLKSTLFVIFRMEGARRVPSVRKNFKQRWF